MTPVNWQGQTVLFKQIVSQLGIESSNLQTYETVNGLHLSIERFDGEQLSQHTSQELKSILQKAAEAFGDALTIQFILGSKTILQINPNIQDEKIDELLNIFRDGIEPRLDFDLDKPALLKNLIPPENHPNIVARFFFFPEALQRALATPLTRLETKNELWHEIDDQHRLVIIVPDQEINLAGNHLAVIGGSALAQFTSYLESPKPSSIELVRRMRDLALESLSPVKWVYFKLEFLTPLHLTVKGEAPANDLIAEALYTQLMNLCLIYSADRTKGPAEDDLDKHGLTAEWRSTFTEEGHVFDVVWDGLTKIPISDSKRWQDPLTWSEIISFAYSDKIYCFDRLRIIQLTVAHNLEENQTEKKYMEVVSRGKKIQEYSYASWSNFIEGKIKEYFAQLHAVESAVDAATDKFREQVDILTRTAFENALTAIGVLIGTFIAAAFQDKFNPWIFWIGVIAYISYMMIFPHWLGLKFIRERFDQTVLAFEKRCNDFRNRLNATVVDGIVGNIVDQWKIHFDSWYGRAKSIYRGLAIILLIIAVVVTFVTSSGLKSIISATSTPSLTSTPGISESTMPDQMLVITPTP